MTLCGLCLERYKHSREFCPICFELYTEEAENVSSATEEGTKKGESELLLSLDNEEQNISGDEQGVLKDPNKMVLNILFISNIFFSSFYNCCIF